MYPSARRSGRSACPTPTPARPAAGHAEAPVDADVRLIMARLADPGVPAEEKKLIRDTLRQLAHRQVRLAG